MITVKFMTIPTNHYKYQYHTKVVYSSPNNFPSISFYFIRPSLPPFICFLYHIYIVINIHVAKTDKDSNCCVYIGQRGLESNKTERSVMHRHPHYLLDIFPPPEYRRERLLHESSVIKHAELVQCLVPCCRFTVLR